MHLASAEPGAYASIADIARQWALPVAFVRRVIARLVRAGILETLRGQNGGVRLARPVEDISMLDVVEAMEGPIRLNRCLDDDETCPFAGRCPVQLEWGNVTEALRSSLASVRFDELARRLPGHAEAHARLSKRKKKTP